MITLTAVRPACNLPIRAARALPGPGFRRYAGEESRAAEIWKTSKGSIRMGPWDDNSAIAAGPRFCPHCRLEGPDEAVLSPSAAARCVLGAIADLRAILEHTAWAARPKHEIELEAWSPELASGQPGEGTIEWVTVGTFADAMRAQGPRIRLEAEGIPTVLQGERMGSRSMYAVATGGLKLQVPRPLEADARVLLSQSWTSPVSEMTSTTPGKSCLRAGRAPAQGHEGRDHLPLARPPLMALITLLLGLIRQE